MTKTNNLENIKKLKTIIKNAVNDLSAGEMIKLINLSANADLISTGKTDSRSKSEIDNAVSEMIITYKDYLDMENSLQF